MQLSMVRTLTPRAWAALTFESATGELVRSCFPGVDLESNQKEGPAGLPAERQPGLLGEGLREFVERKDLTMAIGLKNKFKSHDRAGKKFTGSGRNGEEKLARRISSE